MNNRRQVHRVALIEHDEISRVGLSHLLQKSGHLQIAGEFSQLTDALRELGSIKPDLVVIRSKFPLVDEVESTRQVKATVPQAHILVLAADDASVFDCLKAGADGYCLMQAPLERLVHAAESVAHGAGWLDPVVAQRVLRNLGMQIMEEQDESPMSLTRREREVVALLGQGLSRT
jgi:DNA-binding NarL/FixJ family response regulator